VLVLAAPLGAIVEQLHELATQGSRPQLVIEVASVMEPAVRAGAGIADFVATHPLAGSERSGAASARANLFENKVWAYDSAAAEPSAGRARSFILEMGATPFPVAAAEHDRIVALTSHLPQMLAVALGEALAEALEREDVRALSGTGLASMLRLGSSSWPVWRSILDANRVPVAQEVRRLADILKGFADALDAQALETLEAPFAAAAGAAKLAAPRTPKS
jgi:prephenate dehydrogenase